MRLAQGRIFEHGEKFKDRYRWPAGVEAVRFVATLKALGVNILRATAVRGAKMVTDQALCAA